MKSECSTAVVSISRFSTPSRGTGSNHHGEEDVFVSDIAQKSPSFFTLYCQGLATADQADDFVGAWHESGDEETRSLVEYLGMTEEEYDVWLMTDRALPVILAARLAGRPLWEFVAPFHEQLLAAGDPRDKPALRTMGYWLKKYQSQ